MRHQHEVVDEVRLVERHLQRDPAAQRIANQPGAGQAMGDQRLVQGVGEQLQGVVDPLGLRRAAIADHVGQDHAIARGHEGGDVLAEIGRPRSAGAAAVDEHHRGSRAVARFGDHDVIARADAVRGRGDIGHGRTPDWSAGPFGPGEKGLGAGRASTPATQAKRPGYPAAPTVRAAGMLAAGVTMI